MTREVVLDTETTGLDPNGGHRIIEIACLEVVDYLPTGRAFHTYVDPECEVDFEAERVHGISTEFLRGKPRFADPAVVDAFMGFVGESRLVAHNAAFDRAFVNHELERAGRAPLVESRWIDTLALAQKRFPGMYNSLDALCKRYRLSLAERVRHGALVDAELLAQVYLELRGGREQSFELVSTSRQSAVRDAVRVSYGMRSRPLPSRLGPIELAAHRIFVEQQLGPDAVWLRAG